MCVTNDRVPRVSTRFGIQHSPTILNCCYNTLHIHVTLASDQLNQCLTLLFQSIYKLKGKDGGRERADQTALNIFVQMDRNKDDKLTQAEFLTGAQHSKSIMNLLQGSGAQA